MFKAGDLWEDLSGRGRQVGSTGGGTSRSSSEESGYGDLGVPFYAT